MKRYNVFGQGLAVEAPSGKYIQYKEHIEDNANLRTELTQVKRELLDVTKSKDYYYKQFEMLVRENDSLRISFHKLQGFLKFGLITWIIITPCLLALVKMGYL